MSKTLTNFYTAHEEMDGEYMKPRYTVSNRYVQFYLKLLDEKVV